MRPAPSGLGWTVLDGADRSGEDGQHRPALCTCGRGAGGEAGSRQPARPARRADRGPTLDDVFLQLTGHKAEMPVASSQDTHRGSRREQPDGTVAIPTAPVAAHLRTSEGWVGPCSTRRGRQAQLVSMTPDPQVVILTVQPMIFVSCWVTSWRGHPRARRPVRRLLMAGIFVQTVFAGSTEYRRGAGRRGPAKGPHRRFRLAWPSAARPAGPRRRGAQPVRHHPHGVVGFIVGFHVHTTPSPAGGIAFLMCSVSPCLVMATMGCTPGTPRSPGRRLSGAGRTGFRVERFRAFPAAMPGPLRAYANHQPVSASVDAVPWCWAAPPSPRCWWRGLVGGHHRRVRPAGGPLPAGLGGAPRGRARRPDGWCAVVLAVASGLALTWVGLRPRAPRDDGWRGAPAEMEAGGEPCASRSPSCRRILHRV